MQGRAKQKTLVCAAVGAVALLAAACGGSSGSTSSQSPKTFGVNATGTVHFWARQATTARPRPWSRSSTRPTRT